MMRKCLPLVLFLTLLFQSQQLFGQNNFTLKSTISDSISKEKLFYAETAGSAASNDNLEDVLMRGNVYTCFVLNT